MKGRKLYSYHTHTNFSDGCHSVEEMVTRAVELGIKELGISDHLIVHKNFKQSPDWELLQTYPRNHIYRTDFEQATKDFIKHKEHILDVASHYSLKVYIGAEVDFFTYTGWKEDFMDFRRQTNLDYYISGNHYFFSEKCDYPLEPAALEKNIPDKKEQRELITRHFATISHSAASGLFDFIAHIDYARRCKLCKDDDFIAEKQALLQTLAQYNVPAETSTKGIRKNGYCYPALWQLQQMHKLGVKTLITDDAHCTTELLQDYHHAADILAKIGFADFWKLK